jgi:CRISPR system Cascade subunit CasB|tara:strand:- start:1671 stop:2219 length:549 start_codon:yes stop_codon:yes gene_type:complete
MNADTNKKNKPRAFVQYIIERCQSNKGLAAALRRADNPDTEYQSWELLITFNIDLEKPWERLPYATITAAIAKAKVDHNGNSGIGRAIASCYEKDNDSDQAKAKLRRLLACDSVEEACRILRPLFGLINSKGRASLDYASLLEELLNFHWRSLDIKSRWAQGFYRRPATKDQLAEPTKEAAV